MLPTLVLHLKIIDNKSRTYESNIALVINMLCAPISCSCDILSGLINCLEGKELILDGHCIDWALNAFGTRRTLVSSGPWEGAAKLNRGFMPRDPP